MSIIPYTVGLYSASLIMQIKYMEWSIFVQSMHLYYICVCSRVFTIRFISLIPVPSSWLAITRYKHEPALSYRRISGPLVNTLHCESREHRFDPPSDANDSLSDGAVNRGIMYMVCKRTIVFLEWCTIFQTNNITSLLQEAWLD